jgi:hypothetical protein
VKKIKRKKKRLRAYVVPDSYTYLSGDHEFFFVCVWGGGGGGGRACVSFTFVCARALLFRGKKKEEEVEENKFTFMSLFFFDKLHKTLNFESFANIFR